MRLSAMVSLAPWRPKACRVQWGAVSNMKSTKNNPSTQPTVASANRSKVKWRRAFYAAGVLVLATAMVATAAITSSVNSSKGIKGDIYSYDETTFTIVSSGMDLQAATLAAAGTSAGSPVEIGVALGQANTALTAGDWFYSVQVQEATVDAVVSGAFQVELFQDGISMGALHMTQVSADASGIEGVAFKWDLGASLPANAAYVVKITAE